MAAANGMTTWTPSELQSIGAAEELQLASRRPDGSLRPFVTMWVVRASGDLYVRSAYGPDNPWYRRASSWRTCRTNAALHLRQNSATRQCTCTPMSPRRIRSRSSSTLRSSASAAWTACPTTPGVIGAVGAITQIDRTAWQRTFDILVNGQFYGPELGHVLALSASADR